MKEFYYLFLILLFPFFGGAQSPLYNYDFTGGFQGWSSNSIECGGAVSDKAQWLWVDDGMIDQGIYSDFGLMNSRTPESGIVVLNSDFLDNNGLDDNIGEGDCPAPQIAELVSPVMDFTNQDTVLLSFNQLYYRFLGYYNNASNVDISDSTATFVGVSTDGMKSWTDIPVNTDLRTFRATQNYDGELTLDITDLAAGQSEVNIRFMWKGDYYVWALDDIRLYGSRMYDLDIAAFLYPASNFETPHGQFIHDTLRFEANVVNLGHKVVDSAYLFVTFRSNEQNNTTLYFEDSILIENLAFNDTMEVEFPNYYIPETLDPGAYAVIYRVRNVERPEEVNLANNVRAEIVFVSENSFRKTDRGEGFGYIFSNDYIIGNYYKINENFQERLQLDAINFSVFPASGQSLAGKDVIVYLLKIDDNVAEDLSDWSFREPLENKKSIAGIGSYTFTSADDDESDPNHRFEVTEFLNAQDPSAPVILEPGSRYIAAVHYERSSATGIIHNIGERITYYPTEGQFSTMVFDYGENQWFINGLGSGRIAVVGMDVKIEMTATEKELTEQEVRVFPNPTSDYVQVEVDLDRPQNVDVYLTDVSGKIIKMTTQSKIAAGLIRVDVRSVPAGTYFLNITSETGRTTKKISVVH